MNKIFAPFLPPWVETGLQPAFYDMESGTVLQQTARMYAKVQQLTRLFNELSEETKTEVENFEQTVNDTVQEYIEKFTELKNFVDDYFDNLDVQEEINNKLDEMAEAGTLADIISEYLNSIAIFGYDNVESMKSSINLTNGSYAKTLGYHTKNDGGSALYKIRTITNDDVVDEATIIEIGDPANELVAELIVNDFVTPEMLGAYGDDDHDDTPIFDILFSKFLNIKLGANKTYKITDTLTFPNNVKLEGCGTTTILKSYITNGSPVLQNLTNVSHFIIKNFYIMGNNDNCYGIYVERPYDNCVIEGIYFSHFYKSAIKIGTTSTISQTLVIQNCIVYASQTQALTEPMFDIYKCFECNILNNKLLGHEPSPSNIPLLRLNNVYDTNIQGNSFAHVAGTGIRINSDSNGDSRNNRIISNTYENITGTYSIELIGTSGHEVSSTIVVEANTYYNAPRLIHCEHENQGMFIGMDSEGGRRNLVIDNNSNKVTEAYANTFVTADNKTLCMSGIGLQGYDKKIRYRAVVNDSADNDYGMQITDKRNSGWKLEIQKGYMGNDLAGNRFKVKSPDGTITKYIGIDNSGNLQAFDGYIS